MKLNPRKLNTFTLFKLPAAYLCGVRTKHLDDHKCVVAVRHRWINQNPFKSMFWAVQGMAAELSTGALMIDKIGESKKNISMLVTANQAQFTKKAKGLITFTCKDGHLIDETLQKAIASGEGETITLSSTGIDQHGDTVSIFYFEWSVKVKSA